MSNGMVAKNIPGIIKQLLTALNLDAQAHQEGPYNWVIEQGSALIDLAYHEKSGLIIGECHLCEMHNSDRSPLYKFLLSENDRLEGMAFSVRSDHILLSLLIHDRQFNTQNGKKLFQMLFEKADYYDNILVEQYGAKWISREN